MHHLPHLAEHRLAGVLKRQNRRFILRYHENNAYIYYVGRVRLGGHRKVRDMFALSGQQDLLVETAPVGHDTHFRPFLREEPRQKGALGVATEEGRFQGGTDETALFVVTFLVGNQTLVVTCIETYMEYGR